MVFCTTSNPGLKIIDVDLLLEACFLFTFFVQIHSHDQLKKFPCNGMKVEEVRR